MVEQSHTAAERPREHGPALPPAAWALAVLILLLAAALRMACLDTVPPGLTHDEAGHGHDAVAILHGARPLYQSVGYGREPLYDYLAAGLMALAGSSGYVLRFVSVLFSMVTLTITFAWVRLAFDHPTALTALALQTVSFWSLSTARQALRSSLMPALFTAAVYLYWRSGYGRGGRGQARWWHMGLFALLVGGMLYTYTSARVLWVIFPVFLLYLLLFHRSVFHRLWLPTAAAVLAGLLVAAPLFAYLWTHPGAEQRLAMLDAPLQALASGDVSLIMERVCGGVAGLFLPGRGDDFLAYNVPGRPVFDPLTGVLFVCGVALCLARWRKPACAFSVIWFLVGISPSLVTWGTTASSTRSIAALPVAFLFPALAAVAGARWGQRAVWAVGLPFVLPVIITGSLSVRDYFVAWGESPGVRAAYRHTLVETARYLDGWQGGGTVVLSSDHPQAPHDPYVLEMTLRRDDLSLRWFDGRRALLFPSEPSAQLIAPASAPLDPAFADLPGLSLRERVSLRPDDLDPFFLVCDWEPQVALAALRERARGVPVDLTLPVNVGDALQFLGYDLRTPSVAPGGAVELVTLWRVTDPQPLRPHDPADVEGELVLFTHMLGGAEAVIGQEDRLDAPAWDWQEGDAFAQIHRFSIPADVSPGLYHLQVGAYRREDGARLPVLVGSRAVDDRILLEPVEVRK